MRPASGVAVEVLLLTVAVALVMLFSSSAMGIPLLALVVAAQASITYLIHCPAHYFVGRALGIRFRTIRMGRTTFAAALPESVKRYSRPVPTPSLSVEKESRAHSTPRRLRAMYLSGAAASTGSAIVFAMIVTLSGSPLLSIVTWAFAAGYLASDIVMSPKAGDVMRANAVKAR